MPPRDSFAGAAPDRRDGVSFRRALSAVGAAADFIPCGAAGAASVGAASNRLRPARLDAAIVRLRCRLSWPRDLRRRGRISISPSPIHSSTARGARRRCTSLISWLFMVCRCISADASVAEAAVSGRRNREAIVKSSFRLANGAQIDPELLAFLVEVAAFEAQRFRGVGHVMAIALELGEKRFALEDFHALARACLSARRAGCRSLHRRRCPARRCGSARSIVAASTTSPVRIQQHALDHIAQLAHISRPRVALPAPRSLRAKSVFGFQ